VKKIVVAGEILVEIMADTTGDGFRAPIALTGPYPSGAPAIFIDQVARLGQPCGIISMVGDDDFGRLNTDRLAADGVDVSAIGIDPDRPTGSAFVRYRADGSRDFVFNIRHSACGTLPKGQARRFPARRSSPSTSRRRARSRQGAARSRSTRTCARKSSTRRAWPGRCRRSSPSPTCSCPAARRSPS
jgi:hypothetical protein